MYMPGSVSPRSAARWSSGTVPSAQWYWACKGSTRIERAARPLRYQTSARTGKTAKKTAKITAARARATARAGRDGCPSLALPATRGGAWRTGIPSLDATATRGGAWRTGIPSLDAPAMRGGAWRTGVPSLDATATRGGAWRTDQHVPARSQNAPVAGAQSKLKNTQTL